MAKTNHDSSKLDHYCPLCTKILSVDTQKCPECGNPPPINGWSELSKSSFPLLGTRVEGHFIFDRFLGSGASGDVYRAISSMIPRKFAVKVFDGRRYVKKELNQELLDRFSREIEVMAELENPHVVSIYHVLEISESSYAYFMDFAPGSTLQQLLDRIERLKLVDTLRLIRQIASALAELHSLKLIHCDVKPDNVIVQRFIPNDLFARLVDFGLVRSIGEDSSPYEGFRGSPLFASPEQCLVSKDIDQRSDIYALGCILFNCIVGHPPFSGNSDYAVIQAQVNAPVPSLRENAPHLFISDRLEKLVNAMLAKDRKLRPRKMTDVIQEIDRIIIYDLHKARTQGYFEVRDEISVASLQKSSSTSETSFIFGSQRLIQMLAEFPIPPSIPKDARRFSAVSFYARTRAILADHNNIIHDVQLYHGGPLQSCHCGDSTITAVTFLNKEEAIASIDLMRNVWCWRPDISKTPNRVLVLDERAYALAGGRHRNELLIGKENGNLVTLDIETGAVELIHRGTAMIASLALAVTSKTIVMVGYWDHNVQLVHLEDDKIIPLEHTGSAPISLAINSDATVGAVLTQSRKIRIYDLSHPSSFFDIMGEEANISKIVFGPNSELLGISVDQKTIRLWDINIRAITHQFRGKTDPRAHRPHLDKS